MQLESTVGIIGSTFVREFRFQVLIQLEQMFFNSFLMTFQNGKPYFSGARPPTQAITTQTHLLYLATVYATV